MSRTGTTKEDGSTKTFVDYKADRAPDTRVADIAAAGASGKTLGFRYYMLFYFVSEERLVRSKLSRGVKLQNAVTECC